MAHRPLVIANEFLRRHAGNVGIDHLKLQKLTYLTNGWWLAQKEQSLVTERPQVWRYGPVFRSLYNSLAGFGPRPINRAVGPFEGATPVLPTYAREEANLVDWIWEQYGALTGPQLSNLTHATGTPWRRLAEEFNFVVPESLEIPEEYDREFFLGLAAERGAGEADAGQLPLPQP